MIICIDIGNSNIKYAIYDGGECRISFRVSTDLKRTSDEYGAQLIEMLHIKDEFVIGESGDIDFKAIFNQFYKNGMEDYVIEIEMIPEVREKAKTNSDAAMDMMFDAARKSAEYLKKADFVK